MLFMDLLESIFTIMFFFLLGYTFVKFRLFPADYSNAFTDFIINVGFPGLVLYNIYNLKFSLDVVSIVFAGYLIILFSILFSFFVGKMMNYDRKTLGSFILVSSFGNTGFLGYPFVLSLYGEEGLRYAVIFDQLAMFLPIYLLAPLVIAYSKGEKSFKVDIKKVLLFPPFIALVVGLVIKPFLVPSIVLELSQLLGKTVIPLILFSVGMNMRFSRLKERFRDVFLVLSIKNILSPFLVIVFLLAFKISFSLPWKVAIIQMAMPPMVLSSIFVINAGLDRDLAVSSVASGIVLSFVTIPFIYFLIQLC